MPLRVPRGQYRKFHEAAQALASEGRGGDTELVHVNKAEERMLKSMGGSGTVNPKTGLREYGKLRPKEKEDIINNMSKKKKDISKNKAYLDKVKKNMKENGKEYDSDEINDLLNNVKIDDEDMVIDPPIMGGRVLGGVLGMGHARKKDILHLKDVEEEAGLLKRIFDDSKKYNLENFFDNMKQDPSPLLKNRLREMGNLERKNVMDAIESESKPNRMETYKKNQVNKGTGKNISNYVGGDFFKNHLWADAAGENPSPDAIGQRARDRANERINPNKNTLMWMNNAGLRHLKRELKTPGIQNNLKTTDVNATIDFPRFYRADKYNETLPIQTYVAHGYPNGKYEKTGNLSSLTVSNEGGKYTHPDEGGNVKKHYYTADHYVGAK